MKSNKENIFEAAVESFKVNTMVQEEPQFQRFSRLNRVLHVLMIISFISLALTGMTLKFSYTGWAVILSHLFGGFETAGYIHRFFAVVMVGAFTTHIISISKMKNKEHKTWKTFIFSPDSMMFNKADLHDLVDSIKWFFGNGRTPAVWTLDILGEVRLLCRVLGNIRHRFNRNYSLVPGAPDYFFTWLGYQHRNDHPQRRGIACNRFHLYSPFLQYASPSRKISDGHSDFFG